MDDEVGASGSVEFQVSVDGKVQFKSGMLTGQSAAVPVSVNVAGAQTLKLTVTNGDGKFSSDHADWADAKLSCAEPSVPLKDRVPERVCCSPNSPNTVALKNAGF